MKLDMPQRKTRLGEILKKNRFPGFFYSFVRQPVKLSTSRARSNVPLVITSKTQE